MRDHIGVVEMAFAFGGAALAEGQQPREPAIGGAIRGVGEQARAVAQIETAADDEADPDLFGRMMRAHDAGKAVAVGDRDRPMTERGRGQHQLVRMRGAAQKREIGGDLQLRVARGLLRKRRHGQTSAACGRRRGDPPGTARSAAPPRPRPGNNRGSHRPRRTPPGRHHSSAIRSGPSARMTRCRRRRHDEPKRRVVGQQPERLDRLRRVEQPDRP